MKHIFLALFSVLSINLFAANEGDRIAHAIQTANTAELASMFNTSIELQTPGSSGVSSREQARIVLDNFFRNNTPVKATLIHETSGTTNGMFVISLQTKTGNYRISVTGTFKSGSFTINEFRIS